MARMTFSGTEDVLAELFRETEKLERKATEMLGEAGKVAVKAWQDAIQEAGHAPPGKSRRATGDLMNSIRASAVKKNGSAYTSSIYPKGRDGHGVGNAEKAFILHYGTSKIKGDHFVDNAEANMEAAVDEVMQRIWEQN